LSVRSTSSTASMAKSKWSRGKHSVFERKPAPHLMRWALVRVKKTRQK
jgi:hypothetical protein